jgi:transcriptional regulator with XRE-family HTH domain
LQTADDAIDLGSRLLESRTRHRWSLADVAARTGLSRAYINALERGKSKRPGAEVLRRLEDVLGPLTSGPRMPRDIPVGLREVADERRMPPSEVQLLAALRIGGRQPQTKARWQFIYDALLASEAMDRPPIQSKPRDQTT